MTIKIQLFKTRKIKIIHNQNAQDYINRLSSKNNKNTPTKIIFKRIKTHSIRMRSFDKHTRPPSSTFTIIHSNVQTHDLDTKVLQRREKLTKQINMAKNIKNNKKMG